jgi:uncharacterized membrane protein (DUF373 family)
MSKRETIVEILKFAKERKSWWLIPMLAVFLALGLVIVMTSSSALSPFIYALF